MGQRNSNNNRCIFWVAENMIEVSRHVSTFGNCNKEIVNPHELCGECETCTEYKRGAAEALDLAPEMYW